MPVAITLAVSIVVHRPDESLLRRALRALDQAVAVAKRNHVLLAAVVWLVDNNPTSAPAETLLRHVSKGCTAIDGYRIISGHGNVGYGCGHNLAIEQADSDLHLIMNNDVIVAADGLHQAIAFLSRHPEAGLLAPAAGDGAGRLLYLCKRYPAVLDLLLRGFAPAFMRRLCRRRLDNYEMRDRIGADVVWDIPLVSGCFMLLRRPLLLQLGGFGPRYFLYFEDYDLSLRVAGITRIVYVPSVQIVHFGGQAASKGWRHIAWFLRSAVTFYNCHGWRWR